MSGKPGTPVGLRAFARARGVALSAVQRAITAGRLTAASVGHDGKGRPVITDPVKAAAEWAAHTRPRVDSRKPAGRARPSALAAATLRERVARAESFELETAKRKRLVLPAADFERTWAPRIVGARTHLLGLPTRAKARLPHLTAADLAVLDALVREALEALAPREESAAG